MTKITEKIMPEVTAWQNRPLEAVYPFVFMDAIHYNVREDHRYVTKAAYVAPGITHGWSEGHQAGGGGPEEGLTAVTLDEAEENLLRFGEKWRTQYPSCVKSWADSWEVLSTLLIGLSCLHNCKLFVTTLHISCFSLFHVGYTPLP